LDVHAAGAQVPSIELIVEDSAGRRERSASAESLVIAGWTGRDLSSLERHMRELEELGVARPATVPVFYRVAAKLLSQEEDVEVLGANSSGEAEPVVFATGGGLWLGIGSDHTDRSVETFSVAASKQICPKPIGRTVWPLGEIGDHWDRLVLRSYVTMGSSRELYQQGSLDQLRSAVELIELYTQGAGLEPGTVMFCGTLPVRGALRGGQRFELELEDPVMRRSLRHAYQVTQLPLVG
jgi:hypothetical protein